MKKREKLLRVLVIASLILLLPISATAMGTWPFRPGHGAPGNGAPGKGGGKSVPEPSTLALLAAAGGGIMMIKKFRKKQ